MPTIEIDFEVFKQLTMRRVTESVSCNDVIRSLLGLHEGSEDEAPKLDLRRWICKGVGFPVGTELRAHYKGKIHAGTIDEHGILVDGKRASSPSDAARVVTHNNVNGWNFWECRRPGDTRWRTIKSLRNDE